MKVYKYLVKRPNEDYVSLVSMPISAQVLSVGIQNDDIVLWARIDNPNPGVPKPRAFIVGNTGAALPYTDGRFIGTVTSSTGVVWHIFENLYVKC